MRDPRRKLEWSDRWMPLVHFPVGAGGADGRHGNVQPCDYMHLCPLSMAVNSSNVGVLRVTLAQLHCVSLNKATRKKIITSLLRAASKTQISVVIQTQMQLQKKITK